MLELTESAEGIILMVRAQPGARRNAVTGEHAGALKISVSAPPDKGKANEAIMEVLAEALDLPKSSISQSSGQTSRQKRFLIVGLSREELLQKLAPAAD